MSTPCQRVRILGIVLSILGSSLLFSEASPSQEKSSALVLYKAQQFTEQMEEDFVEDLGNEEMEDLIEWVLLYYHRRHTEYAFYVSLYNQNLYTGTQTLPIYGYELGFIPSSEENGDEKIPFKKEGMLAQTSESSALVLENSKILQIVSSYLFHNESFSVNLSPRERVSRITPKMVQKAGASLMRGAFLWGEFFKSKHWIGPSLGLFEKLIAKYFLLGVAENKTENLEQKLLKEIEEAFSESRDSTSEYKVRAKEVLLRKLKELREQISDLDAKQFFVSLKMASDGVGLVSSLSVPIALETTRYYMKHMITPLQVHQVYGKLLANCGPVWEEIWLRQSQDREFACYGPVDEFEDLIAAGVLEHRAQKWKAYAKCSLAMTKAGTSLWGLGSNFDITGSNRIVTTAIELLIAFGGFLIESVPRSSHDEEILSLVHALGESFQLRESKRLPSSNLQKYIDSLGRDYTLLQLQHELAKSLVKKDKTLLSYVILSLLLEEEQEKVDRIHHILVHRLGVSEEDISDWKDLARYFGPDFSFAKNLVMYTLRLEG